MRSKIVNLVILLGWGVNYIAQASTPENRSVQDYFAQLDTLEFNALLENGILIDSTTIAEQYVDLSDSSLNTEGFVIYGELKAQIYQDFFEDYLYQQSVEYENYVYVLYFTMAGFDDTQWDIIRWDKDKWDNSLRLDRSRPNSENGISKILMNYDEADKCLDGIRIFISKNYLIMERSQLYHSMYDLVNNSLIMNEESPWSVSGGLTGQAYLDWVKANLHDPITKRLNESNR